MSTENETAIKVIVELHAKPGKRDMLKNLIESIVAEHGSDAPGFLGSTRYEVLDNHDILIEIADWESAEARIAHMQAAMASGVYAPLSELLTAPFRQPSSVKFPDPFIYVMSNNHKCNSF